MWKIVLTLHRVYFPPQSGDKTMSSKEYLENALKQDDDAIDEASLRQDGVRAMIKAFFPQRDCVTLIRPILEESKLQNLIDQPCVILPLPMLLSHCRPDVTL